MERSAKTNVVLGAIALIILGVGYFAWAHAQVVGVTVPSVPGSVSANANGTPGQISVSWSASTESSGTIEGYYVYRNGTQVTATAGTSYIDAGLTAGVYSYTVAAYDANGYQSQQSAAVNATLTTDTTPPTAPTNVTVSGVTSTNSYYAQLPVTISWSASTDNVGVVGYYVYRNNVPITSATSTQTGTSLTDTVGPGTYTYTIAAYDAAQNVSAHSAAATITIAIDSTPPSVPAHVSAQQISANNVNVTWTPSTDAGGVAGYQVFRNGVQVASASGPPYADSGLSTNVEYSYNVAAYDVAGNVSGESQPAAGVTIQPFNGPSVPIITNITLVASSTADVSWNPDTDPIAITDYVLYRDGIKITATTSTSYIDIGLTPGLHSYAITATDVSGQTSAMSASSTVIVPVTPVPTAITTLPPVTVAPTAPTISNTPAPTGPSVALTQSLYYGLRNAQVSALQTALVNGGYLAPAYATGFFGSLTLGAVEKFQCNKDIVCTAGAGWGIVGPKTRAALNALGGTTTASTNASGATVTSQTSTSGVLAEIQALEAEITALKAQADGGK